MLSNSECSGLSDLLQDIEDPELFSILETVTKRMFTTQCRQEAIEKILSCTGKPSDLLRRQKVTKKILFNYLVKRRATVLADWDKAALAKKCLEFWGSAEISKDCDYIDEPKSVRNLHAATQLKVDEPNLDVATQMKVSFTKWFFRIWNTLTGFGPEHFWPNCKLTAELYSPFGCKEESRAGAMDVAIFLANLINTDKYYFHPNDSEDSIQIEIEQHGLIKLLTHGVLHQFSNCIGLFDCAFGLVENPECLNTYKIQLIKVKLQVNSTVQGGLPVNNYPSICQRA